MSRTRLLRPAFFKDADLFDAELASGLPLRLAYAGLWTVTDRAGRFAWKPRELKTDCLPHDAVDFADVLDALHLHDFIRRYVVDGHHFGVIPSFGKHQTFHKTEPQSSLPDPVGAPLDHRAFTVASMADSVAVTGAVTGAVADTGTNCTVPPTSAAEQSDHETLWSLIRTHLYAPDGLCPPDWSESREGSILKALRKQHTTSAIAAAIQGVAVIRDEPGRYGDVVTWLTPHTKATLRVLYHTSSGATPLWSQATHAFWKRENTQDDPRRRGQFTPLAALLAPRSA